MHGLRCNWQPEKREPCLALFLQNKILMKNTWITVALYDDSEAGRTLEAYLKSHGIEARVFNDKLLQLVLFLCPPHATFRVQVHNQEYKKTVDVLNTEPPEVLMKAIHCPECDSLRISYPQMTRKFLLPTLFLHLGIIFRLIKHQAYCETCHNVWTLPPHNTAARPHSHYVPSNS